ncbi:MAG: glycosyltransferase family 2 protein [Flavobacteriales bacterium]|nr:glycosyltransferase family 2 protein [Flavobacteriales bacterium]
MDNLITIIVPVYNEEENVPLLFSKLDNALDGLNHEIIAVNDGSSDKSWTALKRVAQSNPKVKIIDFKRNFGQTAALNAGIQNASGEIIILIDSDLENDPNDIKKLRTKMDEGYDVVSGWRKERWKGSYLTRKLPSLMANALISNISGVHLHDYGCTLKAYRKETIKDVRLYGQMHRFIPVFCKWQGGTVAEIPVNYQPRIHGESNYGLFRIYKVILDLVLIKFLDKFMHRPIHFFGGAGILSFIVMFLTAGLATYYKITGQKDLVETPLPTIAAMFFIVGLLMILLGVIAEMLMRTYYESQNSFPFTIKEKVNFEK